MQQEITKEIERPWLYFGCYQESGHYLFEESMHKYSRNPLRDILIRFDGQLAPIEHQLWAAALSRLPGIGYYALSWWDNSIDKRGGSNSTFFAPIEKMQSLLQTPEVINNYSLLPKNNDEFIIGKIVLDMSVQLFPKIRAQWTTNFPRIIHT